MRMTQEKRLSARIPIAVPPERGLEDRFDPDSSNHHSGKRVDIFVDVA
jgi:hypothetical protein